jgi:hypothetical protein
MAVGLLITILGLFILLWGLHGFGILSNVGMTAVNGKPTNAGSSDSASISPPTDTGAGST